MDSGPTIAARRARLESLGDPRLGKLYERAVNLRDAKDFVDGMLCGYLVREIVDGCLHVKGHSPHLKQALDQLKDVRDGLERAIREVQLTDSDSPETLRGSILGTLEGLRQSVAAEPAHRLPKLGDVARGMGLAANLPSEHVARLAEEARRLGAGTLHIEPGGENALMEQAAAALRNLELFLDAVEPSFTPRMDAVGRFLDAASTGQAPTRESLVQLAAFLVDQDAFRQFYLKLDQPTWLKPLQKAGLLKQRSRPADTREGVRVEPRWWPGEYLVRIAPADPDSVVDAYLGEVSGSTINQMASVGRRIARHLPAAAYKRLHRRILQDLQQAPFNGQSWQGHEAIELVEHLNQIGLAGQAASILGELAKPLPSTDEDQAKSPWHSRETQIGLGYWDLSRLTSAAVQSMGTSGSLALFHTLRSSVCTHLGQAYPKGRKQDLTYIRRRAWNDEDRGYEDPIHILLRGLYRESKRLVQLGQELAPLIDFLWNMEWSAFRRLAMKLLADAAPASREQSIRFILDADQFSDTTVQQEYDGLVAGLAPLMTAQERAAYCQLVCRVINPTEIRQGLEGRHPDEQINQDDVLAMVARERRNRFAPMAEHLSDPWKSEYEDAVRRHGAPRFGFGQIEAGEGGFIPPVNLSDLSLDQIVEKLQETDDARLPGDPLFSGDLYRGLAEEVKKRPAELASPDFAEQVPADWAAAYFSGLWEVARQTLIDSEKVLLAAKAVWQRHSPLGESAQLALARTMGDLVKHPNCSLETVKSAIFFLESIATSAEAPEAEEVWSSTEEALNSGRTHALEHLIEIQRRAHFEPYLHAAARQDANQAMKDAVERWPPDSRSLAAVLGQVYPLLWVLDEAWTRQQADRIFDAGKDDVQQAAWIAYVTWNPPYEVAEQLDKRYVDAILDYEPAPPDSKSRHGSDYLESLGRHLARLWYRGRASKELQEAILAAPGEIVEQVVRTLAMDGGATPAGEQPKLVGRIRDLLNHYAIRIKDGGLRIRGFEFLRIIVQEGHFTAADRMAWQAVVLDKGDVELIDDDLQAALRASPEVPEQASVALALLLQKAPFYYLQDGKASILAGLDWYATHGDAGMKQRLAQACDERVRQGLEDYALAYHRLTTSSFRPAPAE